MENQRKPVEKRKFTEEVRVNSYLSKYQYKKALANKHPKSLVFHGKLTDINLGQLVESQEWYTKVDDPTAYSKLKQSLGKFVIVYVHREYQNPISR